MNYQNKVLSLGILTRMEIFLEQGYNNGFCCKEVLKLMFPRVEHIFIWWVIKKRKTQKVNLQHANIVLNITTARI